jgi:hypothetical protein
MAQQKQRMAAMWNSRSGWSDDQKNAAAVRQVLEQDGSRVDFHRIEKGDDLVRTCHDSLKAEAEVLTAANGDGRLTRLPPQLWIRLCAVKESFERKGLKSTRMGRFLAVVRGMLRVFWRSPHLELRLVTNAIEWQNRPRRAGRK